MSIDPLAMAAVMVPVLLAGAAPLVWIGRLSQRVTDNERQAAATAQSLHNFRNSITPMLTDIQTDIARLLAFQEARK